MNTVLTEIITSLFAVGFLSLFVGWVVRSILANQELKAATSSLETKRAELQLRYNQDVEHLEERVGLITQERDQLASQNKGIAETLRENEVGVHKARTDAIELNRQQAETQERLQRIIAQKDEELKMFRDGATPVAGAAAIAAEASDMDMGTTEAKIASLSAKREAWELERQRLVNISDEQATVAIDPADIPADPFDRTMRMQPDEANTLENDQTIALEDNNLQRPNSYKSNNNASADESIHDTTTKLDE